jgi:hypothetical protein
MTEDKQCVTLDDKTWSQGPNVEVDAMSHLSKIRSTVAALSVLAALSLSSPAQAGTCLISFSVFKAGWFIGGSGGSGVLRCRGRSYPISIGGISAGFLFGASETHFHGTASFPRSPYDVAGAYGAAGAGGAVGVGGQAIVLRNEKGAVLQLTGRQVGLQINADLSGMGISMR